MQIVKKDTGASYPVTKEEALQIKNSPIGGLYEIPELEPEAPKKPLTDKKDTPNTIANS